MRRYRHLNSAGADLRGQTSPKSPSYSLYPYYGKYVSLLLYILTIYPNSTLQVQPTHICRHYRCLFCQAPATLCRSRDPGNPIPAHTVWAGMATINALDLETCAILSPDLWGPKLSSSTTQDMMLDSLFSTAQLVVQVP